MYGFDYAQLTLHLSEAEGRSFSTISNMTCGFKVININI